MKHCFILNPAAGKADRTAELTAQIDTLCRGLDYTISVSRGPGQCETLSRELAAQGGELRLYACGGDGTLSEVVNGAAGYPNCAITHYPTGSGNDFIKACSDPGAFADLDALLDPDEQTFDLIQVNDRLGVDICSIGIDARIGTEIGKYKRLPLVSGKGAYNLSTAVNLFKGIHRHYVVEVDGEVVDGRFTLLCVCNGRFYGGGYQPVPESEPDDGKLEVLLVKKVSLAQVAGLIGKYKAGRYAEYPTLFRHFRAERVLVRCDAEEVINLDGEARYGRQIEMKLADCKLRFFYPKGLTYHKK